MLFSEEYEEIARQIDREEKREEGIELGKEIILNELLRRGLITEEVVKEFSELPLWFLLLNIIKRNMRFVFTYSFSLLS